MKQLDKPVKESKSVEQQLKMHNKKYADMIRRYPQLMNPTFSKGAPAHGVWHKIETADHPPCKSKRRPIINNPAKAAAGKAAWEQMEKDGIIERVPAGEPTDWTSSLHIADKAGGGARPCSDFRLLNQKTVTDAYPLPLIRNFTHQIHGSKVFSVIDLKSAFFNVPIWPSHRHKTTTLDPWGGVYRYNRLPFGLSSGPSTRQRLLETILKDIPKTFIYLDDLLLATESVEEHDKILNDIFKILSDNHMALSIDKCKFAQKEVDYLGYKVTENGIRPLPRKLAALEEFPLPKSQKDVLHYCGALNYFRTSLKGIQTDKGFKSAAAILQPLYAIGTEKLPKTQKFQDIWNRSPMLAQAFQESKMMIKKAVELTHPNPNFPLALFTDASDHSVGGALTMLTPEGDFKPLGFYSAHLNPTQQKYSVFKKELLGAFKSLRHFLPEVYGKHLTIYTDHLPLKNVFQTGADKIPLNDPQVYRQINEIGRFTRDIKHVSGVDNTFADYLSRIKEEEKGTAYQDSEENVALEVSAAESVKMQLTSIEALQDLQSLDPEIKLIRSGDKPKSASFQDCEIDGKMLFCETTSDKPRPYVPAELRPQVMQSLHFDHLGIKP